MKTINDLLVMILEDAERILNHEQPKVIDVNAGICSVVNHLAYEYLGNRCCLDSNVLVSKTLQKHYDSWPYYSGHLSFPVYNHNTSGCRITEYSAEMNYFEGPPKWKGKALDLRISLLNHLIECTK